jgi:hypothetical protein
VESAPGRLRAGRERKTRISAVGERDVIPGGHDETELGPAEFRDQ